MKFINLLFVLLVVTSCATKNPVPPVVIVDPDPIVVTPPSEPVMKVSEIVKFAEESSCAAHFFGNNRGKAPLAYTKGMALMYARQKCGLGASYINDPTYKDSRKDVLAWYGLKANELSTYTILHGLGMRESSGRYCTGRDQSANWVKSQDAEAGLFQAAYVSRVFNRADLERIYREYKGGQKSCLLETFSEGVSCKPHNAKNWGTGEGVNYQKLAKSCPAFATEWAAVLIRAQLRHFGPLIRKEAQYVRKCEAMYQGIEKMIDSNESICSKL